MHANVVQYSTNLGKGNPLCSDLVSHAHRHQTVTFQLASQTREPPMPTSQQKILDTKISKCKYITVERDFAPNNYSHVLSSVSL